MDNRLSQDEAFDFALRRYLDDSNAEEIARPRRFSLPTKLAQRVNIIAAKAAMDIDALVEVALKRYLPQGRTAYETLPLILQKLTEIRPAQSLTHFQASRAESQRAPLRRRFDRVSVDLPTAYSIVGEDVWREARIIDLSGGGARISAATDLIQGCELWLGFALRNSKHKVPARGRVVMSFLDGRTNEYSHGLDFTEIAQPRPGSDRGVRSIRKRRTQYVKLGIFA